MSAIVGHRRARTKADDISRLPETIGTHDAVGSGEADKVWSRPSSFRRTPSVVNARLITLVIPAHAGTSPRNQQNRRDPRPHPEIPEFAWMTGWGRRDDKPSRHSGARRNLITQPTQPACPAVPRRDPGVRRDDGWGLVETLAQWVSTSSTGGRQSSRRRKPRSA